MEAPYAFELLIDLHAELPIDMTCHSSSRRSLMSLAISGFFMASHAQGVHFSSCVALSTVSLGPDVDARQACNWHNLQMLFKRGVFLSVAAGNVHSSLLL